MNIINKLSILLILMFCFVEAYAHLFPQEPQAIIKVHAENLASKIAEAEASYVNNPSNTLRLSPLLLDFAVQQQDVDLFFTVNRIAANTFYYHGFFSLWEEHCKVLLADTFVINNQQLKARLYNHLAIALEMQQKFDASLVAYLKARELILQTGNLFDYHTLGLNIALLYEKVRQFDKSFEILNRAKVYFEEINDTGFIALSYQNLGMIHDRLAEYDSSEFYTRKSLELYKHLGDTAKILELHLNMAAKYLKYKDVVLLEKYLNEAEVFLSANSAKGNLFNLLAANKANLLNNYVEADSLFRLAIIEFKAFNRTDQLIETYRGIILNSIALGNKDYTEALLNELVAFQKEHLSKTVLDKFAEYELKYKSSRLEDENVVLALQYENQKIRMRWLFIFLGFVTLAASLITILYIRLNNAYKKLYTLSKASLNHTGFPPVVMHPLANMEDEREEVGERVELFNDAVNLLTNKKIYKDSKLSLQELATALNSNTKYLSRAINKYSDMNYNAFINEFRVNEAKKILSQPGNTDLSMDAIAAMVGFSHRSQFYRVFSAATGLTPVQFRKLNKEA